MKKIRNTMLVLVMVAAAGYAQAVDTTRPLSESEREGLLLMVEEESLARDIYLALYEKWGLRTFSQIAAAEEQHQSAVAAVLVQFGLTLPADHNTPGVFSNPDLQAVYDSLLEKGLQSPEAAFQVGATVEDLDIYDLKVLIGETENPLLQDTYANLLRGSENHIRAFTRQLSRYGTAYQARYISDAELRIILGGGSL